jgi:hypothetical protein
MLADCALIQADVQLINAGHAASRTKAAVACNNHIPDTASASIIDCNWKAEAAQWDYIAVNVL